jgi:AcrR family transcriptional regulator
MSIPQSSPRRAHKENTILKAAEKVFSSVGFANTKMDDIAKEAGISKGTVYFYFDTKENLYMAVTYQALQTLNDYLYRTIDNHKEEPGLECVLAILDTYLSFCDKFPFYSEVMLDYMTLNRTTKAGKDKSKLTAALMDSMYFRKIQDIQNLPIILITQEIKRGMEDGSINNKRKPELLYLIAWASVTGFVKLNTAAGRSQSLLHVSITEWKTYHKEILRSILLQKD